MIKKLRSPVLDSRLYSRIECTKIECIAFRDIDLGKKLIINHFTL